MSPHTAATGCPCLLLSKDKCGGNCIMPGIEPLPLVVAYHDEETAPDADGLIVKVYRDGVELGTLHCINVTAAAHPILKWFAKKAGPQLITGGAKSSRHEAVKDLMAWWGGKTPEYVKHGIKTA